MLANVHMLESRDDPRLLKNKYEQQAHGSKVP